METIPSLSACHICSQLQRYIQCHSYHSMCFPVPWVTGPQGHLQSVCFLTVLELKSLILPENVFMHLVKELVILFCFSLSWCVCVCVYVCVCPHSVEEPCQGISTKTFFYIPTKLPRKLLLFFIHCFVNSIFLGFSWILFFWILLNSGFISSSS